MIHDDASIGDAMPATPKSLLTTRSLLSAWRSVFSATMITALTGMTSSVLAARVLGATQYGAIALALSAIAIGSTVASLGYYFPLLRFGPQLLAANDGEGFRGLKRSALTHSQVAAIAIALIGTAVLVAVPGIAPKGSRAVLLWAAAALPFATGSYVMTLINRSLGRLQLAMLPDTSVRHLVLICLSLLGFAGLSIGRHVWSYGAALFVACIASVAVGWTVFLNSRPAFVRNAPAGKPSFNWLKASSSYIWIDYFSIIKSNMDLFIVAALFSTKEAGIYAVAARLGDALYTLTTTLNYAMTPRIADALARRDRDVLVRDQRNAALILTVMGLATAAPLMLFAPMVMGIFGEEFGNGATALLVIAGSGLVRNLAGPNFNVLGVSGHERTATAIIAIATVSQLTLLVLLTPALGATGAAIARALADIFIAIAGWIWVRRKLGLSLGLPALFAAKSR